MYAGKKDNDGQQHRDRAGNVGDAGIGNVCADGAAAVVFYECPRVICPAVRGQYQQGGRLPDRRRRSGKFS